MSGRIIKSGKPAQCICIALAHGGIAALISALLLLGGCIDKETSTPSQTVDEKLTEQSETMQPIQKTKAFQIKASVNGKEVPLNTDQQERLLAITLKVFSSCTMRSRERVAEYDWEKAWKNVDCVRVHFAQPRLLDSPARPQTRATDVLVLLSDAGPGTKEVWVRDGATYYSPFMGCDESLRLELSGLITQDK